MWGNGCRSPTRPWDGPGHVRRHAGRMVVREVGEDAGITWFAGEPVGTSALNGSVPIGSQPEKAPVTYWLRQRMLRRSTKPLGVRARVSDRWRDLSRAAPEHHHLQRLQQAPQVQQQPVVLHVDKVEIQLLLGIAHQDAVRGAKTSPTR